MFHRVTKHITPATILALVALVFAVTGGAFAATDGSGSPGSPHATLTAGAAKAKPKTKAGPRGPAGPKGATGATGATGAAGPAGATGPGGPQGAAGNTGATGNNGENGKEGAAGAAGTSVKTTTIATKGSECEGNGGVKLTPGGAVCNGKEGTFGGQALPAGKSLTGVWAGSGYAGHAFSFTEPEEIGIVKVAVSLPLPVSPGIVASNARYIGVGEGENEEEAKWAPAIKEGKCKGDAETPVAAEGYLCVFGEEETNLTSHPEIELPLVSGTTVGFTVKQWIADKGRALMGGVWTVTAG